MFIIRYSKPINLRRKHDVVPKIEREEECFDCEPGGTEDDFCLPDTCPERIIQPQFPSATSSFPPEQLAEIDACIEKANELLLTLGLQQEEEEEDDVLLQNLHKLKGQMIEVTISCTEEDIEPEGTLTCENHYEKVHGKFIYNGVDFIILHTMDDETVWIPFTKIRWMIQKEQEEILNRDQPLLNIDPCLRREITFNFGQIVPKSPFLLKLFFPLQLSFLLKSFIDCALCVKTFDNKETRGTLVKVTERSLLIETPRKKQGIDFEKVCFIKMKQPEIALLKG
ncbi:hypothetical protein HPB58_13995 [Priestia filamentosa]|uniref:hypothetical protein n=1 Tax=Priestia filamentosa TaxID=1402861 RepID=UPI001FB2C4CB|nr:hypothetical protein [Priestia filamentosa]MED3727431.1 hypothetical protein [Priestia filamentosa]UOE58455.1 hypothetical protein HPB58_13995 [Priestia filamentosa]